MKLNQKWVWASATECLDVTNTSGQSKVYYRDCLRTLHYNEDRTLVWFEHTVGNLPTIVFCRLDVPDGYEPTDEQYQLDPVFWDARELKQQPLYVLFEGEKFTVQYDLPDPYITIDGYNFRLMRLESGGWMFIDKTGRQKEVKVFDPFDTEEKGQVVKPETNPNWKYVVQKQEQAGFLVSVPKHGTYFVSRNNADNTVDAKHLVLKFLGYSKDVFVACNIQEV